MKTTLYIVPLTNKITQGNALILSKNKLLANCLAVN